MLILAFMEPQMLTVMEDIDQNVPNLYFLFQYKCVDNNYCSKQKINQRVLLKVKQINK